MDDNNHVQRGDNWPSKARVLVEVWRKIEKPLLLILSQITGWALGKWLG